MLMKARHGPAEDLFADACVTADAVMAGGVRKGFEAVGLDTPLAYWAAYPPAQRHTRIPRCVAMAYGQPQNRTF
jgi:hypothetical protein